MKLRKLSRLSSPVGVADQGAGSPVPRPRELYRMTAVPVYSDNQNSTRSAGTDLPGEHQGCVDRRRQRACHVACGRRDEQSSRLRSHPWLLLAHACVLREGDKAEVTETVYEPLVSKNDNRILRCTKIYHVYTWFPIRASPSPHTTHTINIISLSRKFLVDSFALPCWRCAISVVWASRPTRSSFSHRRAHSSR